MFNDGVFVVTGWWAGFIALAAIGVVLAIAHLAITTRQSRALDIDGQTTVARRRRGVKALAIGKDGRASTSKVQVLLWTFAVLYAFTFLLVWGRSVGCEGDEATTAPCTEAAEARQAFRNQLEAPLDTEYYVLLGLPTAAALAAKALTSNKVADGTIIKPNVDEAGEGAGVASGLAELVSNDQGSADLLDFQYLAFNLLTLAYFALEFVSTPSNGLPEIPPTLLALSGVAVAAYTGKKTLEESVRPGISTVIPRQLALTETTTFSALGTGFGRGQGEEPPAGSELLLDGFPVDVTRWDDRRIDAQLSADLIIQLGASETPAAAELTVLDASGGESEAKAVELVSADRATPPPPLLEASSSTADAEGPL